MTRNLDVPDEYAALYRVYEDAYEQASEGKGKERHASEGEAYEDQIICEVTRRLGPGYPLGQAVKKIYESQRIGGEKGRAELLGAINYIAAAVIVDREMNEHDNALFAAEHTRAESENRQKFKPGDAVEWNSIGRVWRPAVYLREFGDFGLCAIQIDGRERIVCKVDLRRPEASHPENPDSSTEAKPKFKHGDKVQCRVELPSVSDRIWVDGEYVRYEKGRSRPHVVFTGAALELVSDEDIRPVPKAEGCEDLVFDEARMRESMPGIVPQDGPSDFDAPQTRETLFQHILSCNPATYGRARKPTGEELAELAEEEGNG